MIIQIVLKEHGILTFQLKQLQELQDLLLVLFQLVILFFFAQNNLQNDSSTGVYYSNGKIGVISAVTNNFKPSIDKPIPTLVYYNYRNFSNPSYYYWYQNRSVLTNLSVLNGTYNFTFDFDYLGKHYSIKKRMIISY